jgi:uncharacterized membrane protein YcgQ (UPF0703/DUF1980 family)
MLIWCDVCITMFVIDVTFRATLETQPMPHNNSEFLLNSKSLRTTLYLSLLVAHLLFGMLHPESIVIAAAGFAFFASLVLAQLRPATQTIKIDKTLHSNK